MAKFQSLTDRPGYFLFNCPGCKCDHFVNTNPEYGAAWKFNGDIDNPTVTPSILVGLRGEVRRCHSFIQDGHIKFLQDCDHDLKGKTVKLLDYEFRTTNFWNQ